MVEKYVIEVAWGKNVKTNSAKKEELKRRIKSKLKAIGREVKLSAFDMGKKVSKHAYSTGKAIKEEQTRKGGFYNLKGSSNKKIEKVKKSKRKVVFVYPKRTKRFRKIKIQKYPKHKKIRHSQNSGYNQNNPFGLSF